MEAFIISSNSVLPIFLLMFTGYFAKKRNILQDNFVNQANKFVFKFALPAMIFKKISGINISDSLKQEQYRLMIFITCLVFLSLFIAYLYSKPFIKKEDNIKVNATGTFMQQCFRCNFVIVGYPILYYIYGDNATLNIALSTLIIIPLFNILSVIILSKSNDGLKKVFYNVFTNPLLHGIVLGFIFSCFKLSLPIPINGFLDCLANLSTPLALISVGAFFNFTNFKNNFKTTIAVVIFKLILLPVSASLLAILLGFNEQSVVLIAVLFGGPSAVSSFAMSSELHGDIALAGNTIILTSSLCVLAYIPILTFLFSVL